MMQQQQRMDNIYQVSQQCQIPDKEVQVRTRVRQHTHTISVESMTEHSVESVLKVYIPTDTCGTDEIPVKAELLFKSVSFCN